jgi:N utilization substance protein A
METNHLNLMSVIEQVGKEKNIDRDVLVSALEAAMLSAARKKHGPNADLEARFNPDVGEVEVYEFRRIVKEVVNTDTEISFQDAKKLDPDLTEDALGEDLGIKLDSKEFGRIAAQNAKQIIVQRVREAERTVVFDEYKDRKGELVTGIMRRFERGAMIVDLGRAEAVVPVREQMQKDSFRVGDRVMAYVLDVLEASRGAQIVLSRTHPNMVVKLFEQEVPEIAEGVVSVEGVAREAGFRSKIAVRSKDSDVDPVGACVGMKGARVQAVVQELRGEKIDIVPFDQDEARFVCNALAPAEVTRVLINEGEHSMQIVVPDDQLSLAIGRRGQNVRLAAELTGWKIDIHSESKVADERELAGASMSRVEGLSEFQIQTLYNHGFRRAEDVASADENLLGSMPGIEKEQVVNLIEKAKAVLAEEAREGALEQDRARMQAKVLLRIDRLADSPESLALSLVADEAVAQKLSAVGFDDIIDLHLMKFPEAAVLSSQVSLDDLKALKKKATAELSKLLGMTLDG